MREAWAELHDLLGEGGQEHVCEELLYLAWGACWWCVVSLGYVNIPKLCILNYLLTRKLIRCESTAIPTLGTTLPALEKCQWTPLLLWLLNGRVRFGSVDPWMYQNLTLYWQLHNWGQCTKRTVSLAFLLDFLFWRGMLPRSIKSLPTR